MGKRATDDADIMRELSRDPLVLKGARVDTLHGLSELMREASRVVSVSAPTQILYGLKDQIIPREPVCTWLGRLAQSSPTGMRVVLYPDGYHMLTRYSGRARVMADMAAWLRSPGSPPPSGYASSLDEARALVCAST
jgi:alpha-beta hydrolase superfamily lysophospholipase